MRGDGYALTGEVDFGSSDGTFVMALGFGSHDQLV